MLGQYLLIFAALLLLFIPRKYAALFFLSFSLLLPRGALLILGSLHLFPSRFLILVGLLRLIAKREFPTSFPVREDWWLFGFALIALVSSPFHKEEGAFIFRCSLALDSVGTYLLFRSWIKNWEDITWLIKGSVVLLIILAVTMFYEKLTDNNIFSYIGQTREYSAIREGKIRAQGPFSHSIIAGTMGAVYLPLAIAIWRESRRIALIMLVSIAFIVFASASSGPVLTCIAGIVGLYLWRYRYNLRTIRWAVVCGLIFLELIMQDHVWYLMARIDIVGGSTGWHRARLISETLNHLNEWWLAGTDYTRHWMPTGVSWSPDHTDITNYYIKMGVIGGLPLMLCFIKILSATFKRAGEAFRIDNSEFSMIKFQVWCLGSTLFAHSASMISVGYFDQSIVSLFSLVGVISSGCTTLLNQQKQQPIPSSANNFELASHT